MNSTDIFLLKLNDYLKREELHVNAFVLKENGEIKHEEYRQPYKKGEIYLQYSVCKLLTSIITGIAIDKGYFFLNDSVISFFPDKAPAIVSDNLNKMKIHHLLSMTTGRTEIDYYDIYPHSDWVEAFLALDVPSPPGSVYQYSSHVSHVLSAIIHKTTGIVMSEFAADNLFKPMGIDKYEFETWKDGETVGGMGISISTISLSKIGEMLLNRGQYKGRRILSEDFFEKMTTNYAKDEKYGYAIHIADDGSFYHPGGFGQLIYIIPELNIVIAVNSAAQVHRQIIEFIQNNVSVNDNSDYAVTNNNLKSLLLENKTPANNDFSYKFSTGNNPHNIETIHLSHNSGRIKMKLIGIEGREIERYYPFEVPLYWKTEFVKDTCCSIQEAVSSAYWEDDNTLILQTIYPQTPYCERYIFNLGKKSTLQYMLNPTLGPLSPLTPMNFKTAIYKLGF